MSLSAYAKAALSDSYDQFSLSDVICLHYVAILSFLITNIYYKLININIRNMCDVIPVIIILDFIICFIISGINRTPIDFQKIDSRS